MNKKPYYFTYIQSLQHALEQLTVTDLSGEFIGQESAFQSLIELSRSVQERGGRQFLCGNGASAAFADHMALDWTKNGKVTSLSFGTSALLSAVVNDWGANNTFSEPISWYARDKDLLAAISSSGNSPNIVRAIETARTKNVAVVTFTGLRPDNQVRQMGDLNFYIQAHTYGVVECSHQVLLHVWLDQFMQVEEWSIENFQNMRHLGSE